jgi:hypothetical protein
MPTALLGAARKLLAGEPAAWDKRRAISTAYYALFHFLSLKCADGFVGSANDGFSRARRQAYRSLDHGAVKAASVEANDPARGFPEGIVRFASAFRQLQELRHAADYEEEFSLDADLTLRIIEEAEGAMLAFDSESAAHQRAFLVLAALRKRSR